MAEEQKKEQTVKFSMGGPEGDALMVNGRAVDSCFDIVCMLCEYELEVKVPEGAWLDS